jgi:hypothetical protein
MKLVKNIIDAKNAAPLKERSHSRLTPARMTNGICSMKSNIKGISSMKIIAATKMAQI